MREVALYDPNRKPASWMELIQAGQYAVFLSDVETRSEMDRDGHYLDSGITASCLIFDSFDEAEQYCQGKVEEIPNLRCDVFDRHGRVNPPVAIFVGKQHQGAVESQAKAERMMRWAFVAMAASLPWFWYTWKTHGEGWMASFVGVQFVFLGLRLLHWGYSMKEELRNRKAQWELRRQQNGDGGALIGESSKV